MLRLGLLVSVVCALASAAGAQPFHLHPDTRDQLTFSVARATTVENDEMTVTLAAVETHVDATRAADAVNQTMQAALSRARKVEAVELRSGAYSTNQVYPQPAPPAQPREPRWRVEQELVLASSDFDTLRALVTELQATLQLKSVGFTLSDARRIEEERRMRAAALAAFREDAELMRESLGFGSYEIVELQVSGTGHDPVGPRAPYAMMSLQREGMADVAPVVLEGGSSDVGARVDARIQLLR